MNDRIRIAEAMGFKVDEKNFPELRVWRSGWVKFDPFTNANDDYAILEWMRSHRGWLSFIQNCHKPSCDYKIGDYYRTALTVIKGERS